MSTVQKLIFQDLPGYQYKVLPDGIHPINEEDLDILFVKPFPDSVTRQNISNGFYNFRKKIQSFFASEMWIDGSFVESKRDPIDVDVVVLILAHDFNNLSQIRQDEFIEIFRENHQTTKTTYLTDAYFMIVFPKDHLNFNYTQQEQFYWQKLFGRTRTKQSKGLIKLEVPFIRS
ncbi:MAG: hypothetical protein LBL38_03030 [Lactobacillales bacterium]|jgi:hypothetical protein|nr:hypothetical protein [Lactobacillales bacterium]